MEKIFSNYIFITYVLPMKKLVIGILAHVDAGKTTLSESILYLTGKIRKLGRVDNKDAYLDNYELERERGITIFSKQAIFDVKDLQITLLDTPGHMDFSAEMERTLQVIDYAILVISGADGVQGHTKTLWRLLELYKIPVFIFINKMDQDVSDKKKLMQEMKKQLNDGCIDFGKVKDRSFYDKLAMCDEDMLESYLEKENIDDVLIKKAILNRKVFPCFFGSALKLEGIKEFMEGIRKYSVIPSYPKEFGAKVFKISRDEQGNRLTHMKITGGKLKVKYTLTNIMWEEKVNQIRIYSGEKFETVNEIEAGSLCAVTGLTQVKPGEGIGKEQASKKPVLDPVLSYRIILPEGCDARLILPQLRQIEEEEPELHIEWNEHLQEIQVQMMGEVQIEILQSLIHNRFGIEVDFDAGRIVYKETIGNKVEGVGHFEPLRHYAEVHLLLEPSESGSGLQFSVDCSEDMLGKNWQRLILTHLKEKAHKGVLTGSAITDMKITLVSGKAHNKHTQGGDFREATYRAVRQGLKEAESILLEPYYEFQLELPDKMVGRAMTDIERMYGTCEISQIDGDLAILVGTAPAINMRNYQKEVIAYTKGLGRLFYNLKGYMPCHNTEEIIESIGYDSEGDTENPTSSIFCKHGTGYLVNWDEVKKHMHVESYLQSKQDLLDKANQGQSLYIEERGISLEEINQIINNTYYANQGEKSIWKKQKTTTHNNYESVSYKSREKEKKEKYLLIDGYNIIFAWPELNELAKDNMDSAKTRLLNSLSNYKGISDYKIIVVFDAYRIEGHLEEIIEYENIYIVYTKEAQTADQYIEKFAYTNIKNYDITVATSDGLQQIIIRGAGCYLLSARELKIEIERANDWIKEKYQELQKNADFRIEGLSTEIKQQVEELIKKEK